VDPTQVVGLFTTITGSGLTTMLAVVDAVHPLADVPVMVYMVVTNGENVTDAPVTLPGCQVYELAPEAFNVAPPPKHTVAELTTIVGVAKMMTLVVPTLLQPPTAVTVTV